MITKDFECYEVSCDYCPTGSAEVAAKHKGEVAEQIKNDGWLILRADGDFMHKCPDCVGE